MASVRAGLTPEGGLAVAALVVAAIFTAMEPRFLTTGNLTITGLDASILLIVAIGLSLPILVRGIDVSVGSIVAISSVLGGLAAVESDSATIGLLLPCLIGAMIGLGNGIFIGIFRLNPLIVTLASLAIFRGLALSVTDGALVTGLPTEISYFALNSVGPFRIPMLVAAAIFAVFVFVLYKTRWGTYIYALGANPRAAEISGVRVRLIIVVAYVLSGLLAGLVGAVLTSRTGVGSPVIGRDLEFQVLPIIFLGGMVFMGGRGNLWGVLSAVVLMSVLFNGLKIIGVQPFWQNALPGAVMLAALILQRVMGRSDTWEYD